MSKLSFGDSQFKDIRHMVRHLLSTENPCQLNRNYLIARVWEELDGLEFTEEQKAKISKATPAESITRLLRAK